MSPRRAAPVLDRLMAKVIETAAGCWQFTGNISTEGYGQLRQTRPHSTRLTHRIAFEAFVDEIPPGMTLDHLCRNRACCNPWHLEVVDLRTNLLRGQGVGALNAIKTKCANGHPYNEVNTYHVGGKRQCRICNRETQRRYRQRKASA